YRCLERALAEPPLPETHATVLYELGCAALLTSPSGTVAHLRAALAMDGLEPGARIDAVCRLSQALVHLGHVSEAVQTIEREAARLEPG
ncbi:ATP-binding protein, partial [Streptomyces parvus]|nr:ATP-binding protein [Streptomyces parvus]